MPHTLDSVDHYWEGDTLHLPFTATDADGNPENINGWEIRWALSRGGDEVLSTADEGVTVNRDDAAGEFVVEIAADATDGLGDRSYRERLQLEDTAGTRLTFVNHSFDIERP